MYRVMKILLVVPELRHVLGVVGSLWPIIPERRTSTCCSKYTTLCRSRNRDKYSRHALQNTEQCTKNLRLLQQRSQCTLHKIGSHAWSPMLWACHSNIIIRMFIIRQIGSESFTGLHQTVQLAASSVCLLISSPASPVHTL